MAPVSQWYSTGDKRGAIGSEESREMSSQSAVQSRSQFRCNVIDHKGTVSFVAPPHGLKVIAASIASGASSFAELMAHARRFDSTWAESVNRDLNRFDEHNVETVGLWFDTALSVEEDTRRQSFRVIDQTTRRRSLVPGGLGLVVFNLKEQRIIQVQNSYEDLRRKDRGRVRINGKPTRRLFQYELPSGWAIVP